MRGGTSIWILSRLLTSISIHPPRAGRDEQLEAFARRVMISIHPPRAGRDRTGGACRHQHGDFNPPAPCGAGRNSLPLSVVMLLFQSTRPVRGGTIDSSILMQNRSISIHPPRAGRDRHRTNCLAHRPISIHPPRAGRDRSWAPSSYRGLISIHPPRAGRDSPGGRPKPGAAISIHPPRAGRDPGWKDAEHTELISIHPPRAGRDLSSCTVRLQQTLFQSTRPVRGGTKMQLMVYFQNQISIHPPRAGRD